MPPAEEVNQPSDCENESNEWAVLPVVATQPTRMGGQPTR
jgi:hypothetical protein